MKVTPLAFGVADLMNDRDVGGGGLKMRRY
jgi:hypothetical protein